MPDRQLRRRAPRLLAAALIMAGLLLALRPWLFPVAGPLKYAALALLLAVGGAAYFGLAHGLRAIDLGELRRLLRRRRKPGA